MSSVRITSELLARYDRPGPRYTSYPTAVEFVETFGPAEMDDRLRCAATSGIEPLALYVHLPFCDARCSFCGCHVVIARRPEVADAYLERVVAEADLIAERLGDRRRLAQYHWGGGTPTHHAPDVLAALHRALLNRFELTADAEVGIEVDPRVTTPEHLAVLCELGFNRVSLGVQDLDATVQELIGRHQTLEQTVATYVRARELGYQSINVDLIYGLPGQVETSFAATIERIVELRPDRLAVYSFAYVPWVRPHQKRIDPSSLPDRDLKYALFAMAVEALTEAGYRQIGMDHFALPSDELARAHLDGTLSRNFMGYTVQKVPDMIALGSSGISDVAGAYAQNHKRLASYYEAVDAGRPPVERGLRLTDDDRIRRHVITELMCNSHIDLAEVSRRFGIDAPAHFTAELGALTAPGGLVEEGLVTIDGDVIDATDVGRPFIRNVAMVFDAYLHAGSDGPPVFSRTV